MSYKIIHVDGGLGNQMCCYANLISVMESNPGDKIYFEKLTYNIKEANEVVSQWNGYELERVFDIKVDDLADIFESDEKKKIISDLQATKFWERGWSLRKNIVEVLRSHGVELNDLGNTELTKSRYFGLYNFIRRFLAKPSQYYLEYIFKRRIVKYKYNKDSKTKKGDCYKKRSGIWYYPLTFEFMESEYLQNKIGNILRRKFNFGKIVDKKNGMILDIINNTNSVSIHARRSDFLQYNNDCYKFGYFKKAVKFIKKKVENPVFFIFSEESEWCKNNLSTLGLNAKTDKIYFIDWNSGETSFRDMQLMSKCKHNIITKSSFGWWASFLNKNPNKITISQVSPYVTTHQF